MEHEQVIEAAESFVDFDFYEPRWRCRLRAQAFTRATVLVGLGLAFGMLLGRSGR